MWTSDKVARWGGEEFLAVLHVPITGAYSFCERVWRDISELLPRRGTRHDPAGVAEFAADEPVETPA